MGVLVAGIGCALLGTGAEWTSPTVAGLVIGLLLIVMNARPMRGFSKAYNTELLTLDEVLYVPMLAMLTPSEVFTVAALATLVGGLASRRRAIKSVFNVGSMLLASGAGIFVTRALGGTPTTEPALLDVLAAMAGAFTFTLSTALLVRAMISYATGDRFFSSLRDIVLRVRPWLGAVTLGGVGILAMVTSIYAGVLVIGLLLFVQHSYGAALREVAARQAAERLQQATSSLRTQSNSDAVIDDLVRAARDLTGAQTVTVVEEGEPAPSAGIRAHLGGGRYLCVAGRKRQGDWTVAERSMLETLAGVAGDVLRATKLIARLRTITYSQSEGVIAVD
ncbi:MAG: hypothetical protein ACRDOJ_14625, partial [Nocardioidaceae bacterium]